MGSSERTTGQFGSEWNCRSHRRRRIPTHDSIIIPSASSCANPYLTYPKLFYSTPIFYNYYSTLQPNFVLCSSLVEERIGSVFVFSSSKIILTLFLFILEERR